MSTPEVSRGMTGKVVDVLEDSPPTLDGHKYKKDTPIYIQGYHQHPLIKSKRDIRHGMKVGDRYYIIEQDAEDKPGMYTRVGPGLFVRWFADATPLVRKYVVSTPEGLQALQAADAIWNAARS